MAISVFDLFTVGIGPSSSHTVGPMRAARAFVADLHERLGGRGAAEITGLRVDLYGSLAATGRGHGTLGAVLLGLEGYEPESVLPEEADQALERIESNGELRLGAQLSPGAASPIETIRFSSADIVLRPLTVLPRHSNGMRFAAVAASGDLASEQTYFSVGGGSLKKEGAEGEMLDRIEHALAEQPYPFATGAELLAHCRASGLNIAQVMLANERIARDEATVREGLLHIWAVMDACKDSALNRSGTLPGGLNVRRRAPEWHRRLVEQDPDRDPALWQEWVNLVALAVNEENASGGRVVTAPTNGAAGIIPAVLFYAIHYASTGRLGQSRRFGYHHPSPEDPSASRSSRDHDAEREQQIIVDFLLTAAAVGVLYKEQASISGAEVGCQGEVGSASSMAAAGLAQVLGGTPAQVENAAEIAMEHNLGLTCDPVGGLVQIPCIERNAIAAAKAINAAKMALMGDGSHHVSLDEVITTMRETGRDMSDKYKETALGGLAVNVIEC